MINLNRLKQLPWRQKIILGLTAMMTIGLGWGTADDVSALEQSLTTQYQYHEARQTLQALRTAGLMALHHRHPAEQDLWRQRAVALHELLQHQLAPLALPEEAGEVEFLIQEYGQLLAELEQGRQIDPEIITAMFPRIDRELKLQLDAEYATTRAMITETAFSQRWVSISLGVAVLSVFFCMVKMYSHSHISIPTTKPKQLLCPVEKIATE